MKTESNNPIVTLKLGYRDGVEKTVKLCQEKHGDIISMLVEYALIELSELDGWVSETCIQHMKAAGYGDFKRLLKGDAGELLAHDQITKEDFIELVDAGIIELRTAVDWVPNSVSVEE